MKAFRTKTAIAAGAIAASTALGLLSAPAANAKPLPPIPNGSYAGTVQSFRPGQLVWYGKAFTRHKNGTTTVINDTIIGRAFQGKVYRGVSRANGKTPVIVVDYSGTPIGFIRDELTSDGRGGYWGKGYNGRDVVVTFHLTKR